MWTTQYHYNQSKSQLTLIWRNLTKEITIGGENRTVWPKSMNPKSVIQFGEFRKENWSLVILEEESENKSRRWRVGPFEFWTEIENESLNRVVEINEP